MAKLSNNSTQFRFPWREGNDFKILVDGINFLPPMLDAIQSARHSVFLEMYLVESGSVINRFISAIQKAAYNSVKVYILFDDYGAIGLKDQDRKRLQHKNIHLAYYNKLKSHSTLYNLYRIILRKQAHGLHRNHRKLLLIDNTLAFVGGIGLTDEFDPPHHPENQWRETVVSIKGPVISDWQQLFASTWNACSQQELPILEYTPNQPAGKQLARISVYDYQKGGDLLHSLTKQINHAQQLVWFSTAYFVPSWRIRRALKRAARSGADVRLLLPGSITDHPAVRYASHRFYGRLLRNGVRIFEYQPRFFHAKCVLCDDWVSIGSSNFDRWNLRWNLEANQEIKDEVLAAQIKNVFIEDFSNSLEFTYEEWQKRKWHLRLRQWFWKKIEELSHKIGS